MGLPEASSIRAIFSAPIRSRAFAQAFVTLGKAEAKGSPAGRDDRDDDEDDEDEGDCLESAVPLTMSTR